MSSVLFLALLSLSVATAAADKFDFKDISGPALTVDPDQLDDEIQGPEPDSVLSLPLHSGLRILADRVLYTEQDRVVDILGHVEVHSPPFIVFADKVRVNFVHKKILALGRVRVVEGNRLIACEKASVQMKTGQGRLERVRFEIRETPVPIKRVQELQAMGHSWPGALWLFGQSSRIERGANGALILRDAEVTPCDCGADPPSWKMRSSRVDIITEHGAWARWPVLEIAEIPVLILPAWYVPLSGRQSGLLAPRLELRDGFWFRQPLYLTLGRSADMTVTPGFVLQRGPRMELEGRWAPAKNNAGSLHLTGQWDEKFLGKFASSRPSLWQGRSAENERLAATRGSMRLYQNVHASGYGLLGENTGVLDLRLSSDRLVAGDFGTSLGARIEPYLRSAAQWGGSLGDDVYVGVQAAAYQDLRQQKLMFFPTPGLSPLRAPFLQARMLPVGLGPLVWRMDSSLLHSGLWGEGPASPLQEDVLQNTWRLDAQTGIDWPLRFGRFALAGVGLAYRQALFLGDNGALRWAGQSFVRGRLSTTLQRSWSWQKNARGKIVPRRLQHRITPFAYYVAQPWILNDGGQTLPLVDERDRVRRGQQLMLGLRNSLWLAENGKNLELLSLSLSQGLNVDELGLRSWHALTDDSRRQDFVESPAQSSLLADTVLFSKLAYHHLGARLLLALNPERGELTTVLSRIGIAFSRRLSMSMSYDYLGEHPTDRLYASEYELFGDNAIPLPSIAVADRLAANMAYRPLENLSLHYGVELAMVAGRPGNLLKHVLAHGGSLTYRSSCKCWEAGLRLRFWPDRPTPDVGFVLTVNGFGEQISIF